MALKIRLRQQGRKNHVVYRLVLTNATSPRDGKYIELLGWYNPHAKDDQSLLNIKAERIFYWITQGAQLTEKASFLVKKGAPEVLNQIKEKALLKKQVKCQKKRNSRKTVSQKS